MMAVNKIGAMAILFCGMILLGATVEVAAVRPGPGPETPCPLHCIIVEYVICDGVKQETNCTNCCFSNGCLVRYTTGEEEICTWPPVQKLGFGKGIYSI